MRNCLFFLVLMSLAASLAAQQQKNNLRQTIISQNTFPNKSAVTESSVQNGNAQLTPSAAKLNESDPNTSKTTYGDSTGTKGMTSLLKPSPDSLIRIGIILPFDAQSASGRLYASMSDDDKARSEPNRLTEVSHDAMDFYEGLMYALNTDSFHQKIALYVYDSQNNDSIVLDLLNNDSLKACDIIIGPTNAIQAKAVAAFCKRNKIINIQPFVASKSFSSENPYLVRFMPTIDAHLQKEYEMVIDSFSEDNIVIFTTKKERDLSAARYLDTLFSSYNAINTHKLKYSFVNSTDSTQLIAKRTLSNYLEFKKRNIVMMTCYDEPVINSQLRASKEDMIIFGMPTWIDAEQVRADYLNKAQPYFTDNYYVDTTQSRVTDFIAQYKTANGQVPSRYSYLGYDAMRYLSNIFHKYGKAFKLGFDNESYDGMGFSFHISPVIRISKENGQPVINYYTNTAMHLFQVSDYKVWLVK